MSSIGDGSTHLVNQAQYDAGKPFTVPPVTLDAVPELLGKVLAGVGAHKPSRDAIDLRIVNSVRDKTGTSRVNTTGPWPDHARGAPRLPPTRIMTGYPIRGKSPVASILATRVTVQPWPPMGTPTWRTT